VPDGDLTIADLAADVLGLLDHLGVERASLAGVSLGGMTAMHVASTAPERVERLVLCCTAARIGTPEMWEERIRTVRESGTAALAEATMQRWFTPAANPATVARFAAVLSATRDKGYAACCAAIRDMDLGEQLASIQAPTLVIAGRHDGSTPPEQGEQIAARIPGARLLIVEHGAHMSNVERAGEVTPAMLEHLGGR
jgi:3-oxoadipate enol-lactonase